MLLDLILYFSTAQTHHIHTKSNSENIKHQLYLNSPVFYGFITIHYDFLVYIMFLLIHSVLIKYYMDLPHYIFILIFYCHRLSIHYYRYDFVDDIL